MTPFDTDPTAPSTASTASTTSTTSASTRTVRVPELVGVPAIEAHDRALDAGLLAVPENATHTAAGRGRIDRQDPETGAEVERGAIVRIWISV